MGRRDYDIAFVGLKQGIHEYQYQVNDKFFEAYQQQDFRNCRANIKLTLDKQNGFMLLKFEIGGVLEVTCARCGRATSNERNGRRPGRLLYWSRGKPSAYC